MKTSSLFLFWHRLLPSFAGTQRGVDTSSGSVASSDWTNMLIELAGRHRFTGEYAVMVDRTLTDADYDLLDIRVIGSPNGPTLEDIPVGTQIVCFENKDRVALNNAVFAHHLRATHSVTTDTPPPNHTLMIKGSNITRAHHKGRPVHHKCQDLWNKCGDNDVHLNGQDHKFFDPLLKVCGGVPIMLNDNLDVTNGKVNSAVGTLSKIVFTRDGPDSVHPVLVDLLLGQLH